MWQGRRPMRAKPRRLQQPGFCGSGCQPIAVFPPWLQLAYSLAGEAVAMGIMGPPLALYVQQKLADMERGRQGRLARRRRRQRRGRAANDGTSSKQCMSAAASACCMFETRAKVHLCNINTT